MTGIILTKNEEKNIKGAIDCLSFCKEIIVVDDYSDDNTREIAKKMGARVYKRKLNSNFAKQRNFGLSKAKGEWVIFLDADERINKNLRNEILEKIKKKEFDGFKFKRKDKFLGKYLRFGETSAIRLLRLAKKNAGIWQGKVHEVWKVKGKVGECKVPIIHKRNLTVSDFVERINFYSSLRARELYEKKVRTNALLILAFPTGKFLQNYILRLGFLDGKAGFVMAVMMSIHSFLVRAKLFLLWKNKGVENPKIPPLKELYEKYD